jgi:hypothetical protein
LISFSLLLPYIFPIIISFSLSCIWPLIWY